MEIKEDALRALRALPENVRRQIGYSLHVLQEDFRGDIKKLKGSKNDVGPRKDIYK